MDGRALPPRQPAQDSPGWTVVVTKQQSKWERRRKRFLPPIFDSGATHSMTPDRSAFIGPLAPRRGIVHLGDDSTIPSLASGESSIGAETLLVPGLHRGLISTGQDDRSGFHTIFGQGQAITITSPPTIPSTAQVVRRGVLTVDNIYEHTAEDLAVVAPVTAPTAAVVPSTAVHTHEHTSGHTSVAAGARLGDESYATLHAITHFSAKKINHMIKHRMALGLPHSPITMAGRPPCTHCLEGRIRKPTVGQVLSRLRINRPTSASSPQPLLAKFEQIGFDVIDNGKGCQRWDDNYYFPEQTTNFPVRIKN